MRPVGTSKWRVAGVVVVGIEWLGQKGTVLLLGLVVDLNGSLVLCVGQIDCGGGACSNVRRALCWTLSFGAWPGLALRGIRADQDINADFAAASFDAGNIM